MIRFYAPDIATNPVLPESDSAHAARVLRMKAGDMLELVDGRGWSYTARMIDPHPKRAMVEIVERREEPLPWSEHITVAVAPTKHLDRMEWLVEKLTEIGVNRIVPLRCRQSERKEIKTERLEKIAVSAMKQSLKAVLPQIDEMIDFRKFVESVSTPGRFMGYCSDEFERKLLSRSYVPGSDVTLLIGPEGDFTTDEVQLAVDHGFIPVTLGDNRLRTETAALVGCDTIHIVNQLKR